MSLEARLTVKLAALVFVLGLVFGAAIAASAHTEPSHQHNWNVHGVVADGLLVGHDSTILCVNGAGNFDTKYERHRHFEKKNSADVWRLTTHYVDALRYGSAWNICG